MKISNFNFNKYLIYSMVFCIVLIYKVFFDLELKSDNLNYYNIYNNIKNDPFPFYFEFITSSIMYFFSSLGFDFYLFTFVKLFFYLPVFIILDYKVIKKKWLSVLFLSSTVYPPFLDMMIFLSRQSLAICFLLLSLLSSNKKYQYLWYCFSIFTHVSMLIYIPLIFAYKKLSNIILNKIVYIALLVFLFLGLYAKSLSGIITDLINNNIDLFPEFIRQNIIMKIGFYDWNDQSDFDPLSMLRIIFICLNIILMFIINKSLVKNQIDIKVIILYLYTLLFFVITVDNNMMATRIGFVSYYFCLSWFFIFLNYSKRFKF